MDRARILFDQRRFDLAAEEIRRHLASDPSDAEALALLSLSLNEGGDLRGAWDAATGAVQAAPAAASAHYAVAFTFCRYACASPFDALAAGFPPRAGLLALAQHATAEAIRRAPNAGYFHLMGWILHQRVGPRPALTALDEGLRLDPNHVECLELRSQLLREMGEAGAASATLHAALALRPESPTLLASRAIRLLEDGRPQEAREHFNSALARDPTIPEAREGRLDAWKSSFRLYRLAIRPILGIANYNVLRLMTVALCAFAVFSLETAFESREARARGRPQNALVGPLLGAAATGGAAVTAAAGAFEFLAQFAGVGRHTLSWYRRFWANLQFAIIPWAVGVCAVARIAFLAETYVRWPVHAGFLIPPTAFAAAVLSRRDRTRRPVWLMIAGVGAAVAAYAAALTLLAAQHVLSVEARIGLVTVYVFVALLVLVGMLLHATEESDVLRVD